MPKKQGKRVKTIQQQSQTQKSPVRKNIDVGRKIVYLKFLLDGYVYYSDILRDIYEVMLMREMWSDIDALKFGVCKKNVEDMKENTDEISKCLTSMMTRLVPRTFEFGDDSEFLENVKTMTMSPTFEPGDDSEFIVNLRMLFDVKYIKIKDFFENFFFIRSSVFIWDLHFNRIYQLIDASQRVIAEFDADFIEEIFRIDGDDVLRASAIKSDLSGVRDELTDLMEWMGIRQTTEDEDKDNYLTKISSGLIDKYSSIVMDIGIYHKLSYLQYILGGYDYFSVFLEYSLYLRPLPDTVSGITPFECDTFAESLNAIQQSINEILINLDKMFFVLIDPNAVQAQVEWGPILAGMNTLLALKNERISEFLKNFSDKSSFSDTCNIMVKFHNVMGEFDGNFEENTLYISAEYVIRSAGIDPRLDGAINDLIGFVERRQALGHEDARLVISPRVGSALLGDAFDYDDLMEQFKKIETADEASTSDLKEISSDDNIPLLSVSSNKDFITEIQDMLEKMPERYKSSGIKNKKESEEELNYAPEGFLANLSEEMLQYFPTNSSESAQDMLSQLRPFIGQVRKKCSRRMKASFFMEAIESSKEYMTRDLTRDRNLLSYEYLARFPGLTDEVYQWVVTMQFDNPYHNLKERFDHLEELRSVAICSNMKISTLLNEDSVLRNTDNYTAQTYFNMIVFGIVYQLESDEVNRQNIAIFKLWIEATIIYGNQAENELHRQKMWLSIFFMKKVIVIIESLRRNNYNFLERALVNQCLMYIEMRKRSDIIVSQSFFDSGILIDGAEMCLLITKHLKGVNFLDKIYNIKMETDISRRLRCVAWEALIGFSRSISLVDKVKLSFDLVNIANAERLTNVVLDYQIKCVDNLKLSFERANAKYMANVVSDCQIKCFSHVLNMVMRPFFRSTHPTILATVRIGCDSLGEITDLSLPRMKLLTNSDNFIIDYLYEYEQYKDETRRNLNDVIGRALRSEGRVFENEETTNWYERLVAFIEKQKKSLEELVRYLKTEVYKGYASVLDKVDIKLRILKIKVSLEDATSLRKCETVRELVNAEREKVTQMQLTDEWYEREQFAQKQIDQRKIRRKQRI